MGSVVTPIANYLPSRLLVATQHRRKGREYGLLHWWHSLELSHQPLGLLPMNSLNTQVAFALHSGIVHLCLDSKRARKKPAESLCREVILHSLRAPVDPDDLSNIQNFIICKGCEARFNLMGYRKFYARETAALKNNPNQLPLF